jgi:hypothetical protein
MGLQDAGFVIGVATVVGGMVDSFWGRRCRIISRGLCVCVFCVYVYVCACVKARE